MHLGRCAFLDNYIRDVCKGNRYPTTLHFMCLGVPKLARLTEATKVYRAPGGKVYREPPVSQ